MLPIILLVGHSGVGKDTVADAICSLDSGYKAVKIALADPAKRIAQRLFGFSNEQLWGPSSLRDTPDEKFVNYETWNEIYGRIDNLDRCFAPREDLLVRNKNASILKYVLLKNFGVSVGLEKLSKVTPRDVIKVIAEDWVNSVDRFYWAKYAKKTAKELLAGGFKYSPERGLTEDENAVYNLVVVSDGRHLAEVVTFAEINAKIVKVISPSMKILDSLHRSVREIPDIDCRYFDYILNNYKTNIQSGIGSLEWKVKELLYELEVS